MVDISLSVTVSRANLGLPALQINDHVNYLVGATFLGGQVAWTRNVVSSPFVDGDVTVNRRRGNVQENLQVEVFGDTQAELTTNVNVLLAAFCQDLFTMDVVIGGQLHRYACEAADYSVSWQGNRFVAKQLQVTLMMPRKPLPAAGVF